MIKLVNTDSIKFLSKLDTNSIDLIVTDPPYKVTKRGGCGTAGGFFTEDEAKRGKIFTHNDTDCSQYADIFFKVLKDGGHCYVMTNHVNLQNMLNTFTNVGFKFIKSLIWDKGNKIMGRFYMSQFEYILFFRKGKGIQINNCGTSDLLSVKNKKLKDKKGKNLHNTEKPVKLMKILIENSSKEDDVVLDPFMGIGAVGVACRQSNRSFIGIEIDKKYFDIATKRINGDIYAEQIRM